MWLTIICIFHVVDKVNPSMFALWMSFCRDLKVSEKLLIVVSNSGFKSLPKAASFTYLKAHKH